LIPGVALFLHEYFDAHGESSLGKFTAKEVTLEAFHTPKGEGICLFFMAWLTPYDLGVSQEVQIYIIPLGDGLYTTEVSLYRVSGYVDSWQRVNLPFLNALRKHFLVWRTYSPEQRQEYSVRGYFAFQEAWDAVGWPPPDGTEEPAGLERPELPTEGDVIGRPLSSAHLPTLPTLQADQPARISATSTEPTTQRVDTGIETVVEEQPHEKPEPGKS
jgi:hypothetical protein